MLLDSPEALGSAMLTTQVALLEAKPTVVAVLPLATTGALPSRGTEPDPPAGGVTGATLVVTTLLGATSTGVTVPVVIPVTAPPMFKLAPAPKLTALPFSVGV